MVRMNPLNEAEGDTTEGRAEDPVSSSSYKRARSSLDYKGDPTADKIIPQEKLFNFDTSSSGGGSAKSQQSQAAAAEAESMFAGMSSEEILRHLYENPELAKSLGIDPKLTAGAGGLPPTMSSASGGANSRKTYRTELLKTQGFPFVQWAIVLLLLGLGIYRVYKAVKPPAAAAKQKLKRKGGKRVTGTTAARDDVMLSKVLAELEESGDEDHGKGSLGKGVGSKKTKKKQPQKVKPKQGHTIAKASDKETVDDSDSEDEPAPVPTRKSKAKNSSSAAQVSVAQQDTGSNDDWHTVGSGKTATANGVGKQKSISAPNGSSAKPVLSEPEDNGADSKKKAKKKKTKKASESNPAANDQPASDEMDAAGYNDEALALRLQEEENNLAVQQQDDVWAEVTNKKKKNKGIEQS